jgi:SSS family transporter
MHWLQEHWLHLAFVTAYLAILVRHALHGHRQVHSLDDYLVAGRSLGGWVIGLSFYATFMSTNTFIGIAGKSWDVGLIWCVGGCVYVTCCCLAWFVVAPRFVPLTKQYQSLTVADFLGTHYASSAVRKLTAAIVCFASVVYLVAIYRGSALALGELLEVPNLPATIVIFVIVTGYTLAGGFSSVVMTDALQGLVMVVGAVGMFLAVLVRGGGPGAVLDSLASQDAALVSWQGKMPLSTIFALSLAVGIKYLVEPRQLSRFYGLQDRAAMRTATWTTLLLVIVSYSCLLPIGALAHALIPLDAVAESDQVIPYLLGEANMMGPVLGVLFLVVLLSAAMSSIDSVLLVAASTIDHDLLASEDTDAHAVRRTRAWVVIVSATSMLVAISPFTKDIMTLTAFSGSLYGACFLPTLVFGLLWKRRSAAAAIASILSGAVAVVAWFIARHLGWTDIHEVYIGLTVGLGVFFAATWALGKE